MDFPTHDVTTNLVRVSDEIAVDIGDGSPRPLGGGDKTPGALATAAGRRILLGRALPLLEGGMSQQQVAKAVGISGASMSRLLRLGGAPAGSWSAAEACRRALALPTEDLAPHTERCGRRSSWEALASLPAVVERLQTLYRLTCGSSSDYMAKGVRTGSARLALLRFADDELCPAPLGMMLRRGAQPRPLMSVIRTITPEIEALTRGPGHYQGTITGLRALEEELQNGTRVPLRPGDVWELDDMSTNYPFWIELEGVGKHGTVLGRQGLYCGDVASSRWLGVELVGRARDAYRAEDILRFLRKLMGTYGKPRRLRIERGVWRARAIKGWSEEDEDQTGPTGPTGQTVPEMDAAEKALLQDGLKALGVDVIYCYTPGQKGWIESNFNYLQSVLPTFVEREAVNIGRHGGEYEEAAKRVRQAHDGVHHPRDLGFLHIDRAADLLEQAMEWIGSTTRGSRKGTIPNEVWDSWLREHPLAGLSQTDLAVFLPEIREVTLRLGHAWVQADRQQFGFINPEVFADLGHGYRVTVRFDPCEPSLGAAIYNRETSSANRAGLQVGQFICWAQFHEAAPMFSPHKDTVGAELVRRFRAFHRTAFRAMGGRLTPAIARAEVRDGRGNVAVRTTGKEARMAPRSIRSGAEPVACNHDTTTESPRRTRDGAPGLTTDRGRGAEIMQDGTDGTDRTDRTDGNYVSERFGAEHVGAASAARFDLDVELDVERVEVMTETIEEMEVEKL